MKPLIDELDELEAATQGGFVRLSTEQNIRYEELDRLANAAPRLLAALQQLLAAWENEAEEPGWIDRFAKAKLESQAAVAEATGKPAGDGV